MSTAVDHTNFSILIIRLGGLGDAVRILPTISHLRQHNFSGQLDCAVPESLRSLIESFPGIDQVYGWPANYSPIYYPKQLLKLRRHYYTQVFDCQGSRASSLLRRLSRKQSSWELAKGYRSYWPETKHHLLPNNDNQPRWLTYFDLIYQAGLSRIKPDWQPPKNWPPIEQVKSDLKNWIKQPNIIVHPITTTGRYGQAKNWPMFKWHKLITQLLLATNKQIYLTWGPGEKNAVLQLAQAIDQPQVQAMPVASSVLDLAWLIKQSTLTITIDSLPAHLADLTLTPAVIIYGTTNHKLAANRPSFTAAQVVTGPQQISRTADITIDQVYSACLAVFNKLN